MVGTKIAGNPDTLHVWMAVLVIERHIPVHACIWSCSTQFTAVAKSLNIIIAIHTHINFMNTTVYKII